MLKKFPSDLEEVKAWRGLIFDLFAFYTGSGVNDLHGAIKQAYMTHKVCPDLVTRSAKILRQYIFGHVSHYDPAIQCAVYILFDWDSFKYQYDGVKEKTKERRTRLECFWNDTVNRYYNEGF